VWDNVRRRKHIVKNAESFVAAASGMPKVHVEHMSNSAINDRNRSLDLQSVFENAQPVQIIAFTHYIEIRVKKIHAFILTQDGETQDAEAANGEFDIDMISEPVDGTDFVQETNLESPVDSNSKSDNDDGSVSDAEICIGSWFVVEYDGEVMEIGENDFRVSVMHHAGNSWKWLHPKDDKTYYLRKQMIRDLEEPIIANNRGHFKFSKQII